MLQHIFSFLPSRSLISVLRTSRQWRDLSRRPLAARIQSSLADSSYIFSDNELDTAADLVTIGYLSEVGMKNLATRIQSLWSSSKYCPNASEVACAAALVTSGHLPCYVVTKQATRIQSSWADAGYYPHVNEVRCAAAMVTTGHLTSVERMQLRNLELPSREDITISSLAKVVRKRVELRNVTGDLGPLLSSLRCAQLYMENMALDQAASCSGVKDRVVLCKVTGDIAPLLSSLTCTKLVMHSYGMEHGPCMLHGLQATISSLVRGLPHSVQKLVLGYRALYRQWRRRRLCHAGHLPSPGAEMMTWAARVNWDVSDSGDYFVMTRK